jgi:hypothetical protein
MMAVVLLVSTALFMNVEDPARRYLRKLWGKPRPFFRPATIVLAVPFFAALLMGVNSLVTAKENSRISRAVGIVVNQASYGANCGAASGNVTSKVRATCEGQFDCSYIVDVSLLGDSAPGCAKAFSVEFVCAPDKIAKHVNLPGEAGFKSVAHLQCKKR